jgi:arginyl-tRNA synthetase
MHTISDVIAKVTKDLFNHDAAVILTRPDEQFGDYATNVALQLAGKLGKNPREVAQTIVDALKGELGESVKEVTIAGPGFINIALADAELLKQANIAPTTKPQTYKDQVVVTEYSDPNPFKALHAGHLYTTVVGDAISRLVEATGAKVHRVNFGW